MSIRIATYNLENLFTRPAAMMESNEEKGRQAIEDHAAANLIAAKAAYSAQDKAKLLELSARYGWHLLNAPENALVQLQKIRGSLFRNPQNGPLQVAASGRGDWTGWFELRRKDVTWRATYNTGRVISTVNPDILVMVEIENRPTFKNFNEQVLAAEFSAAFPHFMVVDGNDDRGIDVGVASRFPIRTIQSHVDDKDAGGNTIFSRDCPEYEIELSGARRIAVLPNHFKSKRNGDNADAVKRRTAQAVRAHEIAMSASARLPLTLIAGDLNDTPDSAPVSKLFKNGFEDVMTHPDYPKDRPGTYGTGLASGKIDYLTTSPALRAKLQTCGIERRGSYHPNTWEPFDTVTKPSDEASDHHLLWADFDL